MAEFCPHQESGTAHGRTPLDFAQIIIIHKFLDLVNVLCFTLFIIVDSLKPLLSKRGYTLY